MDMLNVYKAYSEYISHAIASSGEVAVKYAVVKTMRAVKSETLRLIQVCDDWFGELTVPSPPHCCVPFRDMPWVDIF